MKTKFMSPVVSATATTRTMHNIHPNYQRGFLAGHGDLLLLAGGCFVAYLFVVYCCLPLFGSYKYARVASELGYYWGNTLDMMQYKLRLEFYPYLKPLLPYLESFF